MGESAAGSVPGQAEKISTVMCESDRLALELELERCNAFLQWVACDEERQVDELNELVSREDALLDEGQRLQEVFNTADRLLLRFQVSTIVQPSHKGQEEAYNTHTHKN